MTEIAPRRRRLLAAAWLTLVVAGCGGNDGAPGPADPAEPSAGAPADAAAGPAAPQREPADPEVEALLAQAEEAVREARAGGGEQRLRDAERLLERALELDPNSDRAYLALGLLYSPTEGLLADGDDPIEASLRAIELFEQAIRLDPDNRLTYLELYERVLELNPADTLAHSRLAAAQLALGHPGRAEHLARKAVKLAQASNDVVAMQEAKSVLGRVFLAQDRVDLAAELFETTIAHPDGTRLGCAYQGLGELYRHVGAGGDGLAAADPAAVTDAEDAFQRALDAFDRHDGAAALAMAARALELDDRPPRYHVLAGVLALFEQRYGDAERAFDVAALRAGGGTDVAVGRGHLHIARRQHAEAAAALTPVVRDGSYASAREAAHPRYRALIYTLARIGLGWVEANADRHAAAVGHFDVVLAERPDDLLALLGKANSLIGLGRLAEADALLERVLELDPGNVYALAESAVIRYGLGDDAAAERRFLEAAAGDQGYTCPHEGLGLVYLRQGRVDDAREQLETAIAINPDIEYRKYNALARIHLDEGRYDEAEELLRASQANFPHDDEARVLLEELARRRAEATP